MVRRWCESANERERRVLGFGSRRERVKSRRERIGERESEQNYTYKNFKTGAQHNAPLIFTQGIDQKSKREPSTSTRR